jgi:adenine-specific DNA-methyltransferase
LPTGNSARTAYLHCIKLGTNIDPPYNTGNDFIYKDNFSMDKDEYEEELGLYDEDDNRLFKNTETNGRFHSDWCSMIFSRIKLARNILSDNGVIFISIDDNELHNLRKICDEIFGEKNFVADIAVVVNGHDKIRINGHEKPARMATKKGK